MKQTFGEQGHQAIVSLEDWMPISPIISTRKFSNILHGMLSFLMGNICVWVLACFVASEAIAADEWVVGQVTTLSGTNGAELGQGLTLGQQAYFDYVNSQGGVNGRKIRLISVDDHYVPEETVKLTQDVLRQHNPIALIGYRGTANTIALMKSGILTREGIPLVGTLTGAKELQGASNIYQVRTSYPLEIAQLVRQVVRQGLKKIAIFYSNDTFGQSGLQAAEEAVKTLDGQIVAKAGYDKEGDKALASTKSAISIIAATHPNAIILIAVGDPAVNFLQLYRDTDPNTPLYSISIVNPTEITKKLGPAKARGIGFSQVFPFPYSDATLLAREFRKILKTYAPHVQPDYFNLEGFINAKVLVTALRRAGPRATRADLIKSLDSLGTLDLGDFLLQFSPTQRSGNHFTELTVIAGSGNLIR